MQTCCSQSDTENVLSNFTVKKTVVVNDVDMCIKMCNLFVAFKGIYKYIWVTCENIVAILFVNFIFNDENIGQA